jgi:predicted aldo/keto reductase-like oxidoreductase
MEEKLTSSQTAAVEKIKMLIREYALAVKPSFLYTQKEVLKIIEKELCKLDIDYVDKYEIPEELVKKLAREMYDALMEKKDFDRAILFAEHYGL